MGRPSAAGLGKLSEILPVTGKGRDFVPLRRLQRDPHACRQARPTTAAEPRRILARSEHDRGGLSRRWFRPFERKAVAGHRLLGPEEDVLAGMQGSFPLPSLAGELHVRVGQNLLVERATRFTPSMPQATVVLPGRLL